MKRLFKNNLRHAQSVARHKRTFAAFASALCLVACLVTAVTSGPAMAGAFFMLSTAIGFSLNPVGSLGFVAGMGGLRMVNYITGFQGIANSGTATLNIPTNRRYHSLRLWCTIAGTLSDPTTVISSLQLVVNGQIMLEATPAQLINLAKTFRVTPGTGELPIFFTEPWRNDTRTAEATSWDMFGQNTFVLRATFLNPGGAVGCTVTSDFDLERNVRFNPRTQKQEAFLAILKRFNVSINSPSGNGDVTTLPLNYPIQRILLSVSANAISDVLITVDGSNKIFEATKAENQNLLNANLLTGTFFEYPIIFDYNSKLGANLKAQNLDVRLNCSGANTTTFHVMQLVPGYV